MVRKSLQYELLENLNLQKYKNNNTVTAYKKHIKVFAEFAKSRGYKTLKDLGDGRGALQEYSDYLQDPSIRKKEYTPSTIHSKLASPCLALGVDMKEIRKPKRTSGKIVRGRNPEANKQGKAEMRQDKYKRLVDCQDVTGIRRRELAHLEGRDMIRDPFGYLVVVVRRGKGGKKQYQRIIPEYEETILRTFDGIGENQRVFTPEEMSNHINLHVLRAEVAQAAYKRYEQQVQTKDGREKLLEELRAYYMQLHPYDPKSQRKDKAVYCMEWLEENARNAPYKLRGDNKKRAIEAGKQTVYNRLALLAVSVFHLSHWRLDVTITNYLV